MKRILPTIAILLLLSLHSSKSEAQVTFKPYNQFILDEICINYVCYKGKATLAVGDSILYLTRNGKTVTIAVEKVTIIQSHYFFTFAHNRGFLSLGTYDRIAFLFLDKDNITLHIVKSTLNPRDQ